MDCNCWALYAKNSVGTIVYTRYFCADTAGFQPSEVAPSGTGGAKVIYVDCNGATKSLFVETLGSESWVYPSSELINGGNQLPTQQGGQTFGSCDGCLAVPHNCVNGLCVEDVNGIYPSLEACELVCGVNPDGLVCVTPQEWNRIQELLASINSRTCN